MLEVQRANNINRYIRLLDDTGSFSMCTHVSTIPNRSHQEGKPVLLHKSRVISHVSLGLLVLTLTVKILVQGQQKQCDNVFHLT